MAANRDKGIERSFSAAGGKESVFGYGYSTTTKKIYPNQRKVVMLIDAHQICNGQKVHVFHP